MSTPPKREERELLERHVETWRRAAIELEEIHLRELVATDTQEAIRQLFGHNSMVRDAMKETTSGLVEQQAWFAKLRR